MKKITLATMGLCMLTITSCGTSQGNGALIGTGAGAALGAIVGKIAGNTAVGAAIGGAAGAAIGGLGAVNAIAQSASKPIISRSGNISGNGGFCGVQTPYVVISRKIQSLPENYQIYNGYPSNISSKLSDLTGFVKVSKIHLDGIPCTESELDEINEYLTGGIII